MGRIVIACYKPRQGKEKDLEILSRSHISRLKTEGLVTERQPILMKSEDGSIIEVFEWKSKKAIEEAHTNPEVQKIWAEYAEICDFAKPTDIQEFSMLFSEFEPLN